MSAPFPRARPRRQPSPLQHSKNPTFITTTGLSTADFSPQLTQFDFELKSAYKDKNLKEYRSQNEETMNWLKIHYPDYYDRVVFDLTLKMQADQGYHYFKATQHHLYSLLESQPMMAFPAMERSGEMKKRASLLELEFLMLPSMIM